MIAAIVVLLALVWAALDDITTGIEPFYLTEWLTVFISAPLLFAAAYLLLRRRKP